MGIPTRKWAQMVKFDLAITREGHLGSADAILPWGYPCLFCKIDGFSEIHHRSSAIKSTSFLG